MTQNEIDNVSQAINTLSVILMIDGIQLVESWIGEYLDEEEGLSIKRKLIELTGENQHQQTQQNITELFEHSE